MMAPLIDIVFITLVFFMTMSIFSQMETELNISVPKASESEDVVRGPGEIIININKKGVIIVNQRKLDIIKLEEMLKKISSLFLNQPVIIRADEKTYHEHIVDVLNVCAKANIWNISFATTKGD